MFGEKRTQLIQICLPYTSFFNLIGSIWVEHIRSAKEIYHLPS